MLPNTFQIYVQRIHYMSSKTDKVMTHKITFLGITNNEKKKKQ